MRRSMKKIVSCGLAMAVALTTVFSGNIAGQKTVSAEETVQNTIAFRDLSAEQMIQEMGTGWNLGNTMESIDFTTGIPGETSWGAVKTTQELITAVHDMGFNTLRVPVSYGNMIKEDYSIDEAWLDRIQEIVDYGISQDMYVMFNIHHDSAFDQDIWLNITDKTEDELEAMYKKYEGVWKTLATRFKDYDEHLIFEGMNETGFNGGTIKEDSANAQLVIINKLNQLFVDTVRATGGNNEKRWVAIPTTFTNIAIAIGSEEVPEYDFKVPTDPANRVMVSVHTYETFGVTSFGDTFQQLSQKYVQKGIPILLGEYGWGEVLGEAKRAYFYEGTNRYARQYGIIPVAWDNHSTALTNDGFQLVDRENCTPYKKTITDALMRGFYNTGEVKNIEKDDTFVRTVSEKAITSFEVSTNSLTMKPGEMSRVKVTSVTPAENNDVVLWKTADESVATVSNGRIRARGEGETEVTAFTQDGVATQTITVKVDENATNTNMEAVYDEMTYPNVDYDAFWLLKKGETFTSGNNKYQVIVSDKDGAEVAFTGSVKKTVSTVTIPASVSKDGVIYKVTEIKDSALKGMNSLTKLTIGANVKKIGASACAQSKKLANIFIQSNVLKTVAAKAFAGTAKGAVVKMPAAKYSSYQKLLKGKGLSSPEYVKVAGLSASTKSTTGFIGFTDGSWNNYFNNGEDVNPIVLNETNITGEGRYTVSVDWTKTETGYTNGMNFIMVGIANGEKLFPKYCINIEEIKINGKKVSFKKGYTTSDNGVVTRCNIYNQWAGIHDNDANGSTRSYDGKINDKTPKMIDFTKYSKIKTISVTFTYTKKAPLATGKTFTVGDFKYKVTGFKTVAVNGLTSKGKKKTTLTVADTVTKSGVTYDIVSVAANAFKGVSAKKVILGNNVTTIQKKAFAGCKKLSSFECYATLKKIVKGGFSGCGKITVTGWDKNANKALMKQAGAKVK